MCGIVGYVGDGDAAAFLLEGLSRLEYRGYDSSGIAVYDGEKICVKKSVGRLAELKIKLAGHTPKGALGIGHTRWATHGRPSDINAHPHTDCTGDFAVVHNGIIENFLALKEELLAKGHVFKSETDTEVLAHLLEEAYDGDFEAAVRAVLRRIEGSYALVFMSRRDPDRLICTKQDNPLVIGLGKGENFIASDIPAIIARTRRTYILADGEIAVVKKDAITVTNRAGEKIEKKVFEVNWNAEAAEKGGYEHFMLKEIHEQPKAVRATLSSRLAKDDSAVVLEELKWDEAFLNAIHRVYIVACGTAYHAGLVGKYYIEKMARIPVECDIASEFRYRSPIVDEHTLTIVISQSGETIDTLAALKEAKRLGAKTLAVTNVVGSSIAREADQVVYTWAGPEIAVASTKAYTTSARRSHARRIRCSTRGQALRLPSRRRKPIRRSLSSCCFWGFTWRGSRVRSLRRGLRRLSGPHGVFLRRSALRWKMSSRSRPSRANMALTRTCFLSAVPSITMWRWKAL